MTAECEPIVFGERHRGLPYRQRPGAYAVAMRDQQVLVVDAPEGRYLPGGALDGDETALQALRREVLEETGHELLAAEYLGHANQLIVARSTGEAIEKVGHFFSAVVSDEAVAAPVEADHAAHWVDIDEAIATILEESQAWAVRQVLQTRVSGTASGVPTAGLVVDS